MDRIDTMIFWCLWKCQATVVPLVWGHSLKQMQNVNIGLRVTILIFRSFGVVFQENIGWHIHILCFA